MKLKDFSKAEYTAIVSDLHLCEEEPIHSAHPLWKKYKTRQFFFDKQFCDFLQRLMEMAKGQTVELILNGDIFDFDSVTSLPEEPPFHLTWLEKRRGMHPQEDRSCFKMEKILADHKEWVAGIRDFLMKGHRVVIIVGNHDLELHFPRVKKALLSAIDVSEEVGANIRFCEWFYISNKDTLVEHGNQYDPYCVTEDPLHPFIARFNRIEVRVPFGNLATRYLVNGMGFFNPHVDSNFIMSAKEYVVFFFKYMVKAQPLILFTWLWGAVVILAQALFDRLLPSLREPLTIEDRIEWVAAKANATPRMVRELKELFASPAASHPMLLARELWLDRAFLILLAFVGIFEVFLFIKIAFSISFFWMFIPLFLFLPFFIFYSRSVNSTVMHFKEPNEEILTSASLITKVKRIVFGHTHIVRHEFIGPVEHLNSGTWSPAFMDVECEKPIDQKTFVWIYPAESDLREAKVLQFKEGREMAFSPAIARKGSKAS